MLICRLSLRTACNLSACDNSGRSNHWRLRKILYRFVFSVWSVHNRGINIIYGRFETARKTRGGLGKNLRNAFERGGVRRTVRRRGLWRKRPNAGDAYRAVRFSEKSVRPGSRIIKFLLSQNGKRIFVKRLSVSGSKGSLNRERRGGKIQPN